MSTTTDITYAPVSTTPATTTTKSTYAPVPNAPTPSAASADGGVDKDTFLKLMIAQVSHQDPMSPQDSSQWMSQMAQFTEVEQITNMATSSASAQKDSQMTSAVGLIGRDVSYKGDAGTVTGTVQSVQVDSTGPTLTIDGVAGIAPDAITDVG
jgi:flagellar basal-body rod modification protein FlgD